MQLKSQQEIDAAMQKSYGKVDDVRKKQILATVTSTRPEKMDELDAIFSEALTPDEKAFYHDIVNGVIRDGSAGRKPEELQKVHEEI
jgi:hypothetical protein